MKISTRARYALRLMADLARKTDGSTPIHLREIAEGNDLSHGYLEQLMISLRNASLVRGLSGRKGGYVLARPAEQIRIREIIEAVIGPINLADCVLYPQNCERSPICETRPIWVLLNYSIIKVLEDYSLADIADKDWLKNIAVELAKMTGDPLYSSKNFKKLSKLKTNAVCGTRKRTPMSKHAGGICRPSGG